MGVRRKAGAGCRTRRKAVCDKKRHALEEQQQQLEPALGQVSRRNEFVRQAIERDSGEQLLASAPYMSSALCSPLAANTSVRVTPQVEVRTVPKPLMACIAELASQSERDDNGVSACLLDGAREAPICPRFVLEDPVDRDRKRQITEIAMSGQKEANDIHSRLLQLRVNHPYLQQKEEQARTARVKDPAEFAEAARIAFKSALDALLKSVSDRFCTLDLNRAPFVFATEEEQQCVNSYGDKFASQLGKHAVRPPCIHSKRRGTPESDLATSREPGAPRVGEIQLMQDFLDVAKKKVVQNRVISSSKSVQKGLWNYLGQNPEREKTKACFLNEVKSLTHLDHPHVVKILEVAWDPKHREFSTPWIGGGTVFQRLQEAVWCNYKHLLDALLHPQGVVHYDLKSSNVYSGTPPTATIMDFGCSRPLNSSVLGQAVGGTANWRAPEVWTQVSKHQPSADVYSFGCLLVELFSPGHLKPWSKAIDGEIRRGKKMPPEVHSIERVREIAMRCVHFDPGDRPSLSWVKHRLNAAMEQSSSHRMTTRPGSSRIRTDPAYFSKALDPVRESGECDCQVTLLEFLRWLLPERTSDHQRWNEALLAENLVTLHDLQSLSFQQFRILNIPAYLKNALAPVRNFGNKTGCCGSELVLRAIPLFDRSSLQVKADISLGAGSSATVCEGVWTRTNGECQKVAIKRFKPESESAFLREVLILQAATHENVVRLHGVLVEDPLAIVMEYLPWTLASGWRKLDTSKKIVKFFCGLASGLAYLHKSRIVHRDLKPMNVLFDENLEAKICDFGISKVRDTMTTSAPSLEGTFRYLAPECFDNDDNQAPSRDVYAFGLILRGVLEGQQPFEGETREQIVASKLNFPNLELDAFPDTTLKYLAELANECTQLDPAHRPESPFVARALAELLHSLQKSDQPGVIASTPSKTQLYWSSRGPQALMKLPNSLRDTRCQACDIIHRRSEAL